MLHSVDEIYRRGQRQHQPTDGILAGGDRRIGHLLAEARDDEFDAQSLAIEDEAADRIGENLLQIGAVEVADRRRQPFALIRRGRCTRRVAFRSYRFGVRLLPLSGRFSLPAISSGCASSAAVCAFTSFAFNRSSKGVVSVGRGGGWPFGV